MSENDDYGDDNENDDDEVVKMEKEKALRQ